MRICYRHIIRLSANSFSVRYRLRLRYGSAVDERHVFTSAFHTATVEYSGEAPELVSCSPINMCIFYFTCHRLIRPNLYALPVFPTSLLRSLTYILIHSRLCPFFLPFLAFISFNRLQFLDFLRKILCRYSQFTLCPPPINN